MQLFGKESSSHGSNLALSAEQAASSAHQAIDQLSRATRPAISRVASRAHDLVDSISGSTSRIGQKLEKTTTRLIDTEQRLVGASSNYVRAHPLQSAGLALAAGFLVSHLVNTRRSADGDARSDKEE